MYTRAALEGSHVTDFTHPENIAGSVEIMRRWSSGVEKNFQFEKRFIRSDGAVVWASNNITAVELPGQSSSYAITQIIDITEQKLARKICAQARRGFGT